MNLFIFLSAGRIYKKEFYAYEWFSPTKAEVLIKNGKGEYYHIGNVGNAIIVGSIAGYKVDVLNKVNLQLHEILDDGWESLTPMFLAVDRLLKLSQKPSKAEPKLMHPDSTYEDLVNELDLGETAFTWRIGKEFIALRISGNSAHIGSRRYIDHCCLAHWEKNELLLKLSRQRKTRRIGIRIKTFTDHLGGNESNYSYHDFDEWMGFPPD